MKLLKQLSIKERIAMFTTLGVISLVLFFMVNMWFLRHKSRLNTEMQATYSLLNNVSELTSSGYRFVSDMSHNNEVLYQSVNNFDKQTSEYYNTAIELVDSIRNFKTIKKDSLLFYNLNSIHAETEVFYNLFLDLVLSFKEKGTLSVNLVRDWNKLGDEMVTQIAETEDIDLMLEAVQLRKLEKEYLTESEPEILADLTAVIENVKQFIAFSYPTKAYSIENLSEQYLKIAEELSIIDQRIGMASDDGIIQQIANSGNQIDLLAIDFQNLFNDQYKLREKSAFRNLIILYSLVIIAFASLFLLMGDSFADPIIRITRFIVQLAKGEFPEKFPASSKGDIFKAQMALNELEVVLENKKQFAQKIVNDELNERYQLQGPNDSFGKILNKLFDKQNEAIEENKNRRVENQVRRYINEGLAKFSDIMRRQGNDIDQLARLFIQELVKYLDVVQGGIFFVETDKNNEQYLELKGAFAYNRQKYIEKQIKFGQGLVGTCAVERKPVIPKNIPEEYMFITSGLGDAQPSHLVVFPIIGSGNLEGVIELAGFKPLEENKMEFLKQVAESLATALHGIKVNDQTAQLLKKSQEQAAEMSEQEEEMRQNMEELQATQEEASRREEELNDFVKSVNSAIAQMQVDSNGVISSVNDQFLKYLHADKERELQGKNLAEVLLPEMEPEKFSEYWGGILAGIIHEEEVTIHTSETQRLVLKLNYQLLGDSNSDIKRIILFATDVTSQKNLEQQLELVEKENKKSKEVIDFLNGLFENSMNRAEFLANGHFSSGNKQFFKDVGLNSDEITDKHFKDFLNKAETDRLNNIWEELLSKKRNITSLFMRTRPNGDVVWLSSTFVPQLKEGAVNSVVMLSNNITESIKRLTR